MNAFRVLVLLLPLLTSASAFTPSPPRHLIAEMPYLRQNRFRCGPACLGMVLGYYGVSIPQQQLADEFYRKNLSGSLNLDLLVSARRHGFEAAMHRGCLELIREYLRRDIPVIALIRTSTDPDLYHYLVIYGYDDEAQTFTVHSGGLRGGQLGYEEFFRDWAGAGHWMLTVERKKEWQ